MAELPGILLYSELGGNKEDYLPVEDVATDRSSEEVNKAFCAISMMSNTSIKAWVNFTLGSNPLIADGYTSWGAQWKSSTTTLPTLVNTGTGVYEITFPAIVEDERLNGDLHTLNFKAVQCQLSGSRGFIDAEVSGGNQITVNLFNSSDSPSNFTSSETLFVWII